MKRNPLRDAWYMTHQRVSVESDRASIGVAWLLSRSQEGYSIAYKTIKWGPHFESFTVEWNEELIPMRDRPIVIALEDTRRGVLAA